MESQIRKQPKSHSPSFCSNQQQEKGNMTTHHSEEVALQILQIYCDHLKTYRNEVKPPINNIQIKIQLKKHFDEVIIKRTLSQMGKFIKSRKDRKRSTEVRCLGLIKQIFPSDQKKNQSVDQTRTRKKQTFETNTNTQQALSQPPEYSLNELSEKYSSIINKILHYTWHICNARVIIAANQLQPSQQYTIPEHTIYDIHRLCISTSRIYVSKWGIKHITMQAMQITYFNLLKNGMFEVDPDRNGSLCCLIQAILGDTQTTMQKLSKLEDKIITKDKNKYLPQKQIPSPKQQLEDIIQIKQEQSPIIPIPIPNQTKSQQKSLKQPHLQHQKPLILQDIPITSLRKKSTPELQLQWLIYILEYCIQHCEDFIKSTFTQLSNGNIHILSHSAVSLLHFISLLMNKMINDRITTEIVKGYACPIQDIRSQYTPTNIELNTSKSMQSIQKNILLSISITDYQWMLTTLLKQLHKCYKKQLKNLWQAHPQAHSHQPPPPQSHNHSTYQKCYIECIMNIIAIMNCVNFLGGYNHHIQKKTTKLVHQFLFEFLQLSYLIYQLCHSKKNVQLKSPERAFNIYINNLEKILQIQNNTTLLLHSQNPFQSQQPQKPELPPSHYRNKLPLEYCQLVAIIRLLSNLIHINQQLQKQFEQNLKYFRIIMSLTHQLQNQITMKNWAVVFLKYAAQQSTVMRKEMEKLEIQVKVVNGDIPQFM